MKHLLKSDKKGISIIIGYIILISMAVALSIMVFNWLVFYIPGEKEKCPEDISVSVHSISCERISRQLNFTIKNNGLFTINGIIIRANHREGSNIGIHNLGEIDTTLIPGQEETLELEIPDEIPANLRLLEIIPYVYSDDGDKRICPPGIRTKITCN